jgi:hypothetical protein
MKYLRSSIFILLSASCLYLCQSCNTCSRPQTVENITIDLDLSGLADDSLYVNMGREVLYALPTPIKVSMLIKKWGITYQSALLHDPAKASAYLTKKNMAVNFGVYITDLTTAGLYQQSQTVLRYKQALQQLIEGLGLQAAVDTKLIQKMEDKINDRNEVLRIVTEIYASCTAFLQEEDRHLYALAMLSGGWVEGMYIATGTIDEKSASYASQMKEVILDNKPTFDLLWKALSDLDTIPEDAVVLMSQMSDLANILAAVTANNVTPATSARIKEQIRLLRRNFIK